MESRSWTSEKIGGFQLRFLQKSLETKLNVILHVEKPSYYISAAVTGTAG
jgi:hypothetical protein